MKNLFLLLMLPTLVSCRVDSMKENTFKDDVAFLKKHTDVVVLADQTGNTQIAVCPGLQGRIMTSTAGGDTGQSYGWINYELLESGENNPHINAFGGEERLWFGPEGGQYSVFFKKGDPFDLEHWYTPTAVNEESFAVKEKTKTSVRFVKEIALRNYSDTGFQLTVDREVSLLDKEQVQGLIGVSLGKDVQVAAYKTSNKVINTGDQAWEKDTGLVSIWILCMLKPSPENTIVIPFQSGDVAQLGPVVNDTYFGKVPADRLIVEEDVMFFRGDGEYRSKIGLSYQRCKPICGSYDAKNGVLTLMHFNKPEQPMDYVNSMWEIQDKPYAGDVVNSYNDGPPEPGAKPLGPFYELESSSPALALAPNASYVHDHSIIHIQGTEAELEPIAQKALAVSIHEIKAAFQ
jgi:hypothetical protein